MSLGAAGRTVQSSRPLKESFLSLAILSVLSVSSASDMPGIVGIDADATTYPETDVGPQRTQSFPLRPGELGHAGRKRLMEGVDAQLCCESRVPLTKSNRVSAKLIIWRLFTAVSDCFLASAQTLVLWSLHGRLVVTLSSAPDTGSSGLANALEKASLVAKLPRAKQGLHMLSRAQTRVDTSLLPRSLPAGPEARQRRDMSSSRFGVLPSGCDHRSWKALRHKLHATNTLLSSKVQQQGQPLRLCALMRSPKHTPSIHFIYIRRYPSRQWMGRRDLRKIKKNCKPRRTKVKSTGLQLVL